MSKYIHKAIISNRLILDKYDIKDLKNVQRALKDRDLCKNIGAKPIKNIDKVISYIQDNIITFESEKCRSTRIAVRIKDGTFIGNIGVYKRDNYIELGWWLLSEYRHKGYMKEALNEIINHLRSLDKNLKIKANIYDFNLESQKLAESVGMKLIQDHKDSNNYMEFQYYVKEG